APVTGLGCSMTLSARPSSIATPDRTSPKPPEKPNASTQPCPKNGPTPRRTAPTKTGPPPTPTAPHRIITQAPNPHPEPPTPPTVQAPNQRQSRTLQPHPGPRMGLRRDVPQRRRPCRHLHRLAPSV